MKNFKLLSTSLILGLIGTYTHAAIPNTLKLDYAYYAPTSLVVKEQKLLEKALPKTEIKWVFSQGSNRSLEYLNSGSVDFASTAGLAAVLSRANGSPINTVYIQSQPEWTALVVAKNSQIKSLKDLKGKKIAATKGTDPFLFTLQALDTVGLNKHDVQLVHLQHPDGKTALERALVAADHGLADLKVIIQQGKKHLTLDGWVVLEHGYDQADAVQKIFKEAGYKQVRTVKDYGGNNRVTLGQWTQ